MIKSSQKYKHTTTITDSNCGGQVSASPVTLREFVILVFKISKINS